MAARRSPVLVALFFLLVSVGLISVYFLNGGSPKGPSQNVTETKQEEFTSEKDGLRASVLLPRWAAPGKLGFRYRLQWSEAVRKSGGPVWALNLDEPVLFTAWDEKGKEIPCDQVAHMFLTDEFTRGKASFVEDDLQVELPPEARSIVVAFGGSGLNTPKIPLPRR
jgi:hypothetical protein